MMNYKMKMDLSPFIHFCFELHGLYSLYILHQMKVKSVKSVKSERKGRIDDAKW